MIENLSTALAVAICGFVLLAVITAATHEDDEECWSVATYMTLALVSAIGLLITL